MAVRLRIARINGGPATSEIKGRCYCITFMQMAVSLFSNNKINYGSNGRACLRPFIKRFPVSYLRFILIKSIAMLPSTRTSVLGTYQS